ncbi:hypothetical protein L218DRAFT_247321 [Marasmius fiardii PR-910]|nr:hypothetical protein L218DRAFT_247321 [Marasmius fiardii PR-910]
MLFPWIMSTTPPDSPNDKGWKPPRKRSQGACDICRRQKIKCDSTSGPDGRCTHCISFNLECTHHRPMQKRGPKHSYLSLLESRIKSLESTLSMTDNSLSSILRSPSSDSNNHSSPEALNDFPSLVKEENEDLSHVSLADQMQKLSLTTMQRFFGSSSGFSLIHSIHGIRREVTGDDSHDLQTSKRSQLWQAAPVRTPPSL